LRQLIDILIALIEQRPPSTRRLAVVLQLIVDRRDLAMALFAVVTESLMPVSALARKALNPLVSSRLSCCAMACAALTAPITRGLRVRTGGQALERRQQVVECGLDLPLSSGLP